MADQTVASLFTQSISREEIKISAGDGQVLRSLAGELAEKQGGGKKPHHTVGHGNINILAFAGFPTGKKCQKNSNGCIHSAAGNIGNLNPRDGRGAIRFTDEVENAGIAQIICIVSDTVAKRSGLTVPGNRTVDNFRIDLANSLGMASIATKIPGGALLMGAMKKAAQPIKTGVTVGKALKAEPEVLQIRDMFDKSFPGLASAIGVAGTLESQREVENE